MPICQFLPSATCRKVLTSRFSSGIFPYLGLTGFDTDFRIESCGKEVFPPCQMVGLKTPVINRFESAPNVANGLLRLRHTYKISTLRRLTKFSPNRSRCVTRSAQVPGAEQTGKRSVSFTCPNFQLSPKSLNAQAPRTP